MSFDQSKWVWMDGRVIPWQNATTHVSSHALHYGSGVFEACVATRRSMGPLSFVLTLILNAYTHPHRSTGLKSRTLAKSLPRALTKSSS